MVVSYPLAFDGGDGEEGERETESAISSLLAHIFLRHFYKNPPETANFFRIALLPHRVVVAPVLSFHVAGEKKVLGILSLVRPVFVQRLFIQGIFVQSY